MHPSCHHSPPLCPGQCWWSAAAQTDRTCGLSQTHRQRRRCTAHPRSSPLRPRTEQGVTTCCCVHQWVCGSWQTSLEMSQSSCCIVFLRTSSISEFIDWFSDKRRLQAVAALAWCRAVGRLCGVGQVFAAHGQRTLSDINSTMSEGENRKKWSENFRLKKSAGKKMGLSPC
jgi:hypothetical protein